MASDEDRPAKRARKAQGAMPTAKTTTIQHPDAYTAPTMYQVPTPITSFSYGPARELLLTKPGRDSSLSFYREPPANADLNMAFDECVWRDETKDEGLDALLESLLTFLDSGDQRQAREELIRGISVITWRGMMTRLMGAVYEAAEAQQAQPGRGRIQKGWKMNAMMVDDILYLEEAVTPEELQEKIESQASWKRQTYYGYSFESHCTGSSFEAPNTNVQWCQVIKTKLGTDMRLVLGGEVDCVTVDPRNGRRELVELKTNMMLRDMRDEAIFEKTKLLKHFLQSFLLGVPSIKIGFRTREGRVTTVQSFRTSEIPRMVRGKPHAWDSGACLGSAYNLLKFIRASIAELTSETEASPAVFEILFSRAAGEIQVRPLTAEEVSNVNAAKDPSIERTGFLLSKWVNRNRANDVAN